MSYPQIAYEVVKPYLGDLITDSALRNMLQDAYNYEIPLERVYDEKYVLRLDQGPTCSFKDFAARLMGRMIQYFLKEDGKSIIILTATSGDTGSAVAHAFYGLDNIKVVVLFPEKEVTVRQRRQMTTLGKNIFPLAIDGKFDDCQALVKQAFADPELHRAQPLLSQFHKYRQTAAPGGLLLLCPLARGIAGRRGRLLSAQRQLRRPHGRADCHEDGPSRA